MEGTADEADVTEKEDLTLAVSLPTPTTFTTKDDIKRALEEFYLKFNPEKLSTIDHILLRYDGKEIELFSNLMEKYDVNEFSLFDQIIQKEEKIFSTSDESASVIAKSEAVACDEQTTVPNKDSATASKHSVSLTPTKEAFIQPSLATLSSGMQDVGRLFTAWGIGTIDTAVKANSGTANITSSNTQSSPAKGYASVDDSVWSTRVSGLQKEIQGLLGEKNGLEAEMQKTVNQVQ
jgi:hypothetical protein